jgi:hypothetical protein
MGQEIKCRVEFGKDKSEGKALLESTEVLFRGDFRLKIPFQSITALDAAGGKLKIGFAEGSAIFHLGAAAEKWATKIRNPPSRLDKLGVKPGTKVQLINKHDPDFRQELEREMGHQDPQSTQPAGQVGSQAGNESSSSTSTTPIFARSWNNAAPW